VLDLSGDRPVVLDHKTTSDLKWAKTEDDLREDPQMVLYGSYAFDVFAAMGLQTDVVEAGHIVYLTKGAPAARKTMVRLTREHLTAERAKLATVVEQMKVTSQARTPASVEGEASVCDKYGGCDFRDKCGALGMFANASPLASMFKPTPTTQKENDTMSNVDPLAAIAALRAKKAAAAANPAPAVVEAPAPAPTPVVEAPAPSAATGNAAASILARYGVKTPTPAPVAAPAPAPVAAPAPVEAEEAGEKKSVRKPRDYQTKLTALEWTTEQINRMSAESMRAAIDGLLNGKGYNVLPDGALDTATLPVSEMPFESEEDEATFLKVFPEEAVKVASAKAPEASKVMPSESVHPSQQAAVVAPAAPAVPEVAPVPAPVVKPPVLTLYIDCAPEKGRDKDYILLEDYIQPLLPQVVEAYNRGCKRDDEKVPFYSLIPYARGPGFVAALVMAAPPVGVIVANTRFPATNSILEVLIPMADVVVRGTR